MKSPFPPKNRMCRHTGFEKKCFDLVSSEACQGSWINIKGEDPQDKSTIHDNWGCVDDFTHILHLAAIDHARMGAAETEKLRNDLLDRISQQKSLAQREIQKPLQQIEVLNGSDHDYR